MNAESKNPTPFLDFGVEIKKLRLKSKFTILEVCMTLELDRRLYSSIEQGKIQPAEDVVLMLLNLFKVDDTTSDHIWQIAGYGDTLEDKELINTNYNPGKSNPVMVLPQDLRIIYTDVVHISLNNYGMTLNFMQGGGSGIPPLAISRVGMSQDHARSIAKLINDTLDQHAKKNPKKSKKQPPKD